jgi:hypothetical protein
MRGTIPWKVSREKDPLLMQMLIESTTSFGNMVRGCTSSIGMSSFIVVCFQLYLCSKYYKNSSFIHDIKKSPLAIFARAFVHACQKIGRHFVVMEDKKDISNPSSSPSFLNLLLKLARSRIWKPRMPLGNIPPYNL